MKYNDSPINEDLYQKIIEIAIGIIIESPVAPLLNMNQKN